MDDNVLRLGQSPSFVPVPWKFVAHALRLQHAQVRNNLLHHLIRQSGEVLAKLGSESNFQAQLAFVQAVRSGQQLLDHCRLPTFVVDEVDILQAIQAVSSLHLVGS